MLRDRVVCSAGRTNFVKNCSVGRTVLRKYVSLRHIKYKEMETLFLQHARLLRQTDMSFIRETIHSIDWDYRLVALCGPRGVGKTTMMLQYIKSSYEVGSKEALYVSAESLYFTSHTMFGLAESFVQNGGRHLFIDEVHKYGGDWSREIKQIYDSFPTLKVTFSGSSLLEILNPEADLSRRCIRYNVQGLSFREFLSFYKGIELPVYSLDEILHDAHAICARVNDLCRPIPLFHEYLQYGYYPYYKESPDHYYQRIESTINYTLEAELPSLCGVEVYNVRKLKALLGVLSSKVPYQTDMTKLAQLLQASRNTVGAYLSYLSKAKIISLLYSDIDSLKKMQKPDKVYLDNANLLYALTMGAVDIGTARETFVVNQLSVSHRIEYAKEGGDFRVDRKYTFEVGGHSKTFAQIADLPDSYILADDIETPFGNKLPVWMVGLMY